MGLVRLLRARRYVPYGETAHTPEDGRLLSVGEIWNVKKRVSPADIDKIDRIAVGMTPV